MNQSLWHKVKDNKYKILSALLLAKAAHTLYKSVSERLIERKMHNIATKKRLQRDQIIQNFKIPDLEIPLELVNEILVADIKTIKLMLQNKQFTVYQLTVLFVRRCIEVAYPLNLLADVNFESALQLAKHQDAELAKDPSLLNRPGNELYGIPLTVKDCFILKGFDCTVGLATKCFKPYDYDGIQVALIKKAGGIIIAKSNIPQLCMTFDSVNHIYGRALNPWNKGRSTGGSSGGEAGLIASRCSLIGMGSDIGGSIRIPSSFCGVFGLKPSLGRQTMYGEFELVNTAVGGLTNIQGSKGPIGRNVDDLAIMFKVLFNEQHYNSLEGRTLDHYWSPKNWNHSLYTDNRKLRIGVWDNFDLLKPASCMLRGITLATDALKQAGHEVVQFQVPQQLINDLMSMFLRILASEGKLRTFVSELNGEKKIKEYDLMFSSLLIPEQLNGIIKPFLKMIGQNRLFFILNSSNELNAYGLLCLFERHFALQKAFIDLFKEQGLDGLLCPAFTCPAIKHGQSEQVSLAASYTWLWNVMNLPAGVLPVTTVQVDEQSYPDTSDFIGKTLNDCMRDSAGLPVGVQVVTLPHQEEVCLNIMKQIDEKIQFYKHNTYPSPHVA